MKITMAEGSGGKATAQLMEEVFGKYFANDVLDRMEDAGVVELPGQFGCSMGTTGKMAVSTDSFIITPIVFNGGDIGKLSVCGTVNDLLMMGAEPKYITCGFIMEEGLEISLLHRIVESMAEEAKAAGVKIVAGDTKVIEGSGGLYINTTGIGFIPPGREISAANCRPGDAIILTGTIGDHHACVFSARMGIENDIKSDAACLGEITRALFDAEINVRAMRDVTRGGLGTILNELAATSGVAAEISEEAIPIAPAVRGLLDILGLDPVYMSNEGKMIAVVAPEDAEKALEIIKNTELGANAAMIGTMRSGKGVTMVTSLGGTRTVSVLYGQGLPRIC